MTRSLSRRLRVIATKGDKKLQHHLETMGGAYAKETEIHPSGVCLVHEISEKTSQDGLKTKQTRYWYEHHSDRAKITNSHPDIIWLSELAMEIIFARRGGFNDDVTKGLDLLETFVTKYETMIEQRTASKLKQEFDEVAGIGSEA